MKNGADPNLNILNDIVFSMVEYDLQHDTNRLINLIDLYRVFLQFQIINDNRVDIFARPVLFHDFIFDQIMLDKAAAFMSTETMEETAAPIALQI